MIKRYLAGESFKADKKSFSSDTKTADSLTNALQHACNQSDSVLFGLAFHRWPGFYKPKQ